MVRWRETKPKSMQPSINENPSLKYGDSASGTCYCYTPCMVVGMFYHVPTSNNEYQTEDEYFAVVWPCTYRVTQSSVFSNRWEMQYEGPKSNPRPAYQLINCDSIVRQCCMIPENLGNISTPQYFHEIWPRDLWGGEF